MAILKATVTLIGKRPILFHGFSIDTIALEKRERTGVAGNDPEEWKRSVLKTTNNQLYLDSSYIFGCFRDGGKHIKSGRGSIQTKVASTLLVLDETILLDRFLPEESELTTDKTQPVYLDIRSVKNPTTKARNVRYRIAASQGWKVTFKIEWENTVVSREQMHSVIDSAGSFVGLGDGRSIGFGRFTVEQFEIEEIVQEQGKKRKTVERVEAGVSGVQLGLGI